MTAHADLTDAESAILDVIVEIPRHLIGKSMNHSIGRYADPAGCTDSDGAPNVDCRAATTGQLYAWSATQWLFLWYDYKDAEG